MNPSDACPCGTGESYAKCCGPFHAGEAAAPTAERLMRSRFAAFALGLEPYLLETWSVDTRPDSLGIGDGAADGVAGGTDATDATDEPIVWKRLFIHDTAAGGVDDQRGIVEFTAIGRGPDGRFEQRERSRFARDARGHWVYIDGDVS